MRRAGSRESPARTPQASRMITTTEGVAMITDRGLAVIKYTILTGITSVLIGGVLLVGWIEGGCSGVC